MTGITAMPIHYGYVRWSSDEQTDGSSEARQKASILAFAAQIGAQIEWVVDAGVSARDGNNLKHGRIAQLRADILAGRRPPAIIMVEEQTRFCRGGMMPGLSFLAPLLEFGCAYAVVQRKLMLRQGDDAELMSLFTMLIESDGGYRENERRIGQVRTEAAIRRSNLGPGVVYNSRVPDWCSCPNARRTGDFKRVIALIPERAAIVVELFELTAAGYGSQRLAKLFNDRARTDPRYAPWRGTAWTSDVIKTLTANRAVLGEFQPHTAVKRPGTVANPNTKNKRAPVLRIPDGPVRLGYFPVAVSMDLWDRAQAAKARNAVIKPGRPSRNHVNLFSGLCRCGLCGGTMHLKVGSARAAQDRLLCSGSLRGVCKNNLHYSLTSLERAFLRTGFAMLTKASDFTRGNDAASALAAKLDEAKQRVQEALDGLDNVRQTMRFAANDSDRAVVMAQVGDETRKRDMALAERDQIERALSEARGDDPEEAMLRGELLANDAKAGEPEARVALSATIRAVIARVEFQHGRVFIAPSRPASGLRLVDDDGVVVPTSTDRPARRLVVEFGHNTSGRKRVGDDTVIFVEGMDARR